MSTHNLCFEQKYEKYLSFLSENFKILEVKFSIYLNMSVFVTSLEWLFVTVCRFNIDPPKCRFNIDPP